MSLTQFGEEPLLGDDLLAEDLQRLCRPPRARRDQALIVGTPHVLGEPTLTRRLGLLLALFGQRPHLVGRLPVVDPFEVGLFTSCGGKGMAVEISNG